MCRFTRAEFLQGCRALKADNIKSVQQRLPEAAAEALARSDLFKDLYRYTFRFGLASTSCATRYSEGEYAFKKTTLRFVSGFYTVIRCHTIMKQCHQMEIMLIKHINCHSQA